MAKRREEKGKGNDSATDRLKKVDQHVSHCQHMHDDWSSPCGTTPNFRRTQSDFNRSHRHQNVSHSIITPVVIMIF